LRIKDKYNDEFSKKRMGREINCSNLLEIGCGEGHRLQWLQENLGIKCFGVEPSNMAVNEAKNKGVDVKQGSADKLDFIDKSFDILVFGFCLYLCDRDDLFKIAHEANRVLKDNGIIIIMDFFSASKNTKNNYHHKEGIISYKMDYRTLFTWHPFYECFSHKVIHHSINNITDIPEEWIAISLLRKNSSWI